MLFENELVDDGLQVDMHYLYKRSYNELHQIYKNEFIHSESCAMLVKQLNENMIEYRFMQEAGLLETYQNWIKNKSKLIDLNK